jgi:hypothetical protein
MANPLTEGWRYTCRTHEWMSNRVPCPVWMEHADRETAPAGDGTEE